MAKAKTVNKEPLVGSVKKASAIVSELLVSFGAGFAVQCERISALKGTLPDPANPGLKPPAIVPPVIFDDVAVLQKFQLQLLTGCIANKEDLVWTPGDGLREVTLKMAFLHGMFARALMAKSKATSITPAILKQSLDIVQTWCNQKKAGGGPACPLTL